MNDLLLDDDPAKDVQAAYDNSDAGQFAGAPRAAWTIARHSAAMNLGCKIVLAVGPDVKELMVRGTYSNSLRDVIIALWLCTLSETEVIRLNCALSKADEEKAITTAFKWAEKVGLEYGSKLFLEGLALLDSIVEGVWKSFYSTIEGGKIVDSKKNSRPPGKSGSDIMPPKQADTPPGT